LYREEIKKIIESLIFASDTEISAKDISGILSSFRIEVKLNEIDEIISELNNLYSENKSAFEIVKIAGGYQFATRKEFASYIGKLYTETQRKKLTQISLETLAIIAYKQPITRSQIEFIRGVNVDYIVNSLLERELITIIGRAKSPGRPILYGTTKNFLKVLGLNSVDELPKLKEINDILKNEKVEGITEEDIELFNSVNAQQAIELQDEGGESKSTMELLKKEETEGDEFEKQENIFPLEENDSSEKEISDDESETEYNSQKES
jgi:segregation and condensation protein B